VNIANENLQMNQSVVDRKQRLLKRHEHRKRKTTEKSNECEQRVSASIANPEIRKFHIAVAEWPFYNCSCCDQLWYKRSVLRAKKLRFSNPNMLKYLRVDSVEWICWSCYEHLRKNKVPLCAVDNGMSFPVKPDFFDLNELECRLLAPRLAFQKLIEPSRGKQLKIRGNIVNVPADVNTTISILPRLPNQSRTIKV